MEIWLVRHAQPHWEPDGVAVDDPGLTEYGHAQAAATAAALEGVRFDAVYTSPLNRVRETAAPIIERIGVEPEVHGWLREIGLPSLQGQSSEQVEAYFTEAHARELSEWWHGLPGGESFRHFYERVSGGIEALLAGTHRVGLHEDAGHRLWQIPEDIDRLLIVAHEGTNAALLSHLLGIEPVPWTWMRFASAWTGISRVQSISIAGGAVWALESFNRIEHLAHLDSGEHGDGRSKSA